MTGAKELDALKAVGVAAPVSPNPAARYLDSLGREWSTKLNGSLGVIGGDVVADSLAEVESKFGPVEPQP